MANNEKPNSIFFQISNALRGNKKDVAAAINEPKELIGGNNASNYEDFSSIQQKQQEFLDVQSNKIAMDLYSRTIYYDSDRISSYNDYRAMDQSPEISVALDIMADECIEASTIIPLLNGEKITVENLYNQQRKDFWVYSYNVEKKSVEPAICEKVIYKGEQNVYEIIFDDDSSVLTTKEHLWLNKNSASYTKTKDLKIGDSIEPFYTNNIKYTKHKKTNTSIKNIKFVGKRKTYDLINVTDNNNYAILTNNGTGVFVHNCVTRNDKGEILAIYSEDVRIKKVLKSLFYQTLNVNFTLWTWIRELLKYGDNFLKLEIDQKLGIYDILQLPTGEIHKELGVNGNPKSVRYKWDVSSMFFEDFEIAHFSLISDATKLPYGRSILDPARKLWKQLQLAEDAMLVYRLVRAPERRIFYLDVGNSDPADIKQYIESMKRELKKQPVVDAKTGNVNLKYNVATFEEDYFIPVRGGISSKVETLPGASNLNDIADITYLQNKLFTAIKVPKTYLNYAEALPGGSTLSQADLRFSRTINRIQEMVIMELRRIANIHLFILGFEDDLDNFTLTLTNPSTQQELLKLETMKSRNEVFKEMFSSDATAPVSYAWAMEFILGFSKAEIKQILRQKKIERKIFYEIERSHIEYMDTGIFTELDKKFRRPDFDPNTEIDPEETGAGGDSGGSDGGFGGGGSFGGGGMDLGGGMGDTTGGGGDDFGSSTPDSTPPGAELAGADEPTNEPEPEENLKETNKLLRKNNMFNFRTKTLLEGIEHYLEKIKEEDIDDSQSNNDDISQL